MKTMIVTGANRGLGRALLSAFQEAGWFIIATARRADSIPGGNSVLPLVLDLSRYDSVASCAEQVRASGKTVDLLINNAGYNPKDSKDDGYFRSTFNIEHFSGENVADSLHINALAPVEFASKLLPVMSPEAVIVNMSSWLGSIGQKQMPGHYGYAGSKALLNMFTRGMALELGEGGRAAVAVNPGWMATSMGGQNAESTPEEVAGKILALYNDGSLHRSNGMFINTDGTVHPW